MSRNVIETVMGAVVILVAGLFLYFAYTTVQVRGNRGYMVTANFERIEGIRDGSDVRISGIKVGNVVSQTLDPKTYLAVVTLNIDNTIKLPTDTVAQIASSGLLGDKYLSLIPGGEDGDIKPGGQITRTQPAISLESIIGQYIFSQGQKKPDGETKAN